MNMSCDVIRDLLPLVAENMASPASSEMVNAHLLECETCRKVLEEMKKTPPAVGEQREGAVLDRLKRAILRRRVLAAVCALFITAAALFGVFCVLERPDYLPSTVMNGTEELPDGGIVLRFTDQAQRCRVDYVTNENGEQEAVVLAWKTALTEFLGNDLSGTETVIAPGTVRIWYSSNPYEDSDTLLWGRPVDGGLVSLPRSVLAFYFAAALLAGCVFALLGALLRGRRVGFVPVHLAVGLLGFAVSVLLVTGGQFTSYHTTELFLLSLTEGALCCGAVLTGWRLWRMDK